jgi:ribosome recycling factor
LKGEAMIDETYEETHEKMSKTINALKSELKRIRTGRASTSLLDGIKADYYGTQTPINQMATVAIPESRLITVQPWDATAIKEIEKAVLKSDLGLTPTNDGKLIRIAIPPLSEQRRKELVKLIHKTCEEYKVAIRNVRRDANELIKGFKKDGDISEDDAFKAQDQIQKITDEYVEKIEEVYKTKEKEILEF